MKRSLVFVFASCAWAASGCEPKKTPEAALVTRAVDALGDASLSHEERASRLADLRALPLREERALSVRDACVTLHEALIEADRLTKEARARVDAFEAVPAAERDSKEGAEIAALIGRSHEALRRSEDVRDGCLKGVLALESEGAR